MNGHIKLLTQATLMSTLFVASYGFAAAKDISMNETTTQTTTAFFPYTFSSNGSVTGAANPAFLFNNPAGGEMLVTVSNTNAAREIDVIGSAFEVSNAINGPTKSSVILNAGAVVNATAYILKANPGILGGDVSLTNNGATLSSQGLGGESAIEFQGNLLSPSAWTIRQNSGSLTAVNGVAIKDMTTSTAPINLSLLGGTVTGLKGVHLGANGSSSAISLVNGTSTSSATITGTTGEAVLVDPLYMGNAFSLSNFGRLEASAATTVNINGASAGSIVNNAGGVILNLGANTALALQKNLGKFNNLQGGMISSVTGSALAFPQAATIGEMTNAGTLSQTGMIDGVPVIKLDQAITGTFTNLPTGVIQSAAGSGLIAGGAGRFTGGFVNQGTISKGIGVNARALDFGASVVTTNITNTGTINGNVRLPSGAPTFTMTSGVLNGTIEGGDGDNIIALNGGTINGGFLGLVASNATINLNGTILNGGINGAGGGLKTVTVNQPFSSGGVFTNINTLTVSNSASFTANYPVTLNVGTRTLTVGNNASLTIGDNVVFSAGAANFNNTSTLNFLLHSGVDLVPEMGNIHGKLDLTGAALDLKNMPITVRYSGGGYIGNGAQFKLVRGTTAITNFLASNTTQVLSPVLTINTQVIANELVATVTRTSLAEANFGGIGTQGQSNAQSLGNIIELVKMGGSADFQKLSGLIATKSSDDLLLSLNSLAPAPYTTASSIFNTQSAISSVISRLDSLISFNGTLAMTSAGAHEPSRSVWAQAFGSFSEQTNRSNVIGYNADVRGIAFGGDRKINAKLRLGMGLSGAQTTQLSKDTPRNRAFVSTATGMFYGLYEHNDSLYAEGVISSSYNRHTMRRNTFALPTVRVATAKFSGRQFNIKAMTGHIYQRGASEWTPLAGLSYARLSADSYTESGADVANLSVSQKTLNALVASLGGRWSYMQNRFHGRVMPYVKFLAHHDFLGDTTQLTSSFVGAGLPSTVGTFVTKGAKASRNTFELGLGVVMFTPTDFEVKFDYDYQTRSDFASHSGRVVVKYLW